MAAATSSVLARCSGVLPLKSAAVGSAPRERRRRTAEPRLLLLSAAGAADAAAAAKAVIPLSGSL